MEGAQLIVRLVQLLWIIILVGLLGNVIACNNNGNMSSINYAFFATILAWVAALMGLAAAFMTSLTEGVMGYVLLGLDALSTLFVFIAGIVLPAKLHVPNCGGDLTAHYGPGWIGFGSDNNEKRCRELQASTAFLWFLLATFIASLLITLMSARRHYGGSSTVSGPHMSQVRV